MSWVDDIRCLYCDGRLPLYRKITQGQFCSSAHRKEYWKEQERLALERLSETHQSLRAVHVTEAEAEQALTANPALVKRAPEPEIPGLSAAIGLDTDSWLAKVPVGSAPIAADPLEYAFDPRPVMRTSVNTALGELLLRDALVASDLLEPANPIPIAFADPIPFGGDPAPVQPEIAYDASGMPADVPVAAPVATPAASLVETPVDEAMPLPRAGYLYTVLRFAPRNIDRGVRVAGSHPMPATIRRVDSAWEVPILVAGLPWGAPQALAIRAPRTPSAEIIKGLGETALLDRADAQPFWRPWLPLRELQPEMARGCRYDFTFEGAPAGPAEPIARRVDSLAPRLLVTLPLVELHLAGTLEAPPEPDPDMAWLLPNAWPNAAAFLQNTPMTSAIFSSPQPFRLGLQLPALRLEPLFPQALLPVPVAPALTEAGTVEASEAVASSAPHFFKFPSQIAGFWHKAPRDLKILMIAIPLLMALVFHPALPKVSLSSGGATSGFKEMMNASFAGFRQSMVERAAVALDEDFRAGLDDWASKSGQPVAWSYDATGFVQPGDLALYSPTTNLTDYEMQFLGLIGKKAISWVVRAKDFNNYYVVKLQVTKPGPVPDIGITRYAVVNGKAQDRVDTVLRLSNAREDMLYRIHMNVQGNDFALMVQGQMADSWTEDRLRQGGIGFFSARGEESRVRWVQVTHQYDMLGRLCAYFAPMNLQTTANGSFQP